MAQRPMTGWKGRRVFLTGHTGFKGSWLALWLTDLGAEVTGFALPPPTSPSLFELANVADLVDHRVGDIRDLAALQAALADAQPDVVFHLAAQPLVRLSYETPVETYATNVMGTVHLLEAIRQVGGVKAAICITSDKCYENREWVWPYRESDPMGGHDPYSSSKGCAELIVSAYRKSFLAADGVALASVRAGNVIGGGDWAADRLIPDIVRALEAGEAPVIRNPESVRPWQHVLEALGGYILLADRLLDGETALADAFNFGPSDDDTRPVGWIVDRMLRRWGSNQGWERFAGEQPHEAHLLTLDCAKARAELGWRPALDLDAALGYIVDWHKAIAAGADPHATSIGQIRDYIALSQAVMAGDTR